MAFKKTFITHALLSIFICGKTGNLTWRKNGYWKKLLEEPVNNVWNKGNQNCMHNFDYDFYEANKKVNFFT